MNKEEYFDWRLKRDFIDHVLLQKPLLNSKEVSGRLIRSTTDLYYKLKTMIKPVCEKALSKEKLKQDGNYVNKLPEWLNQNIVGEITDNFKAEIRTSGILEYYREELFYAIEKLTWQQGVDDMSLNLQDFISYLRRETKQYEAMPKPDEEKYSIQKLETNAKRITPREFLAGDNYKDILAFRDALFQYSEEMCEYEVYKILGNFYREILSSGRIESIIAKYKNIQAEAEKEKGEMKNLDPKEEWDKDMNVCSLLPSLNEILRELMPREPFK